MRVRRDMIPHCHQHPRPREILVSDLVDEVVHLCKELVGSRVVQSAVVDLVVYRASITPTDVYIFPKRSDEVAVLDTRSGAREDF